MGRALSPLLPYKRTLLLHVINFNESRSVLNWPLIVITPVLYTTIRTFWNSLFGFSRHSSETSSAQHLCPNTNKSTPWIKHDRLLRTLLILWTKIITHATWKRSVLGRLRDLINHHTITITIPIFSGNVIPVRTYVLFVETCCVATQNIQIRSESKALAHSVEDLLRQLFGKVKQ